MARSVNLECLGHVVGRGMVQSEQSKLAAVREIDTPQSKKQVQTFLGLTGYYRRFIPNYASVTVSLTDLTRK